MSEIAPGRPAMPLPPPPPPPPPASHLLRAIANSPVDLLHPSSKKRLSSGSQSRSARLFRHVRSVFRSFPIIAPSSCKMPGSLHGTRLHDGRLQMTGTLFGRRRARVSLAIQDNSRCLPMLVLELAIPTGKLLQDMGTGLVRVALECEKQPLMTAEGRRRIRLLEEPTWTMYCNGRKTGYAVRRDPTEDDVNVMKLLHAMTMGAGVIPSDKESEDGEFAYMRARFEHVVGSRDSETFYMMNPDSNGGPELSIFFVRV